MKRIFQQLVYSLLHTHTRARMVSLNDNISFETYYKTNMSHGRVPFLVQGKQTKL